MNREKKDIVKMKLDIIFTFGYFENAKDVAIALCKAGRYVSIKTDGVSYDVYIYSHFN